MTFIILLKISDTIRIIVDQPNSFKYGLCTCCSDCESCCLGYFCANFYAFCAAQSADESFIKSFFHCLCYPLCLCCLRTKVREEHGIDGSCCG